MSSPPNLAKCPDCGHGVSSAAYTCPNCGRPLRASPGEKASSGAYRAIVLLLAVIIVPAFIVAIGALLFAMFG